MKRILKYILAASFAALMFASCESYNLDNLVDEPWYKILCFRDTSKDLEIRPIGPGTELQFSFAVLKGGSKPELEASAKLVVMSEAEAAEKKISGKLLPEKYYRFDSDLEFKSGETGKLVDIIFSPKIELFNFLGTEGDHIIPVKLVSDKDSVNVSRNIMILKVKRP